MTDSRKQGFTLIELLVVIAIIGILASFVISALGAAKRKARIRNFTEYTRQIKVALEVYYLDNDRYPTVNGGAGSSMNLTNPTNYDYFNAQIGPYIDFERWENYDDDGYDDLFGQLSAFIYSDRIHPWCINGPTSDYGQSYSFVFLSYDAIVDEYYTGVQDAQGRYIHCIEPTNISH